MRHPFVLVVAALIPLACSDTTGGPNTTGAVVTADTLPTEYASAACRSLFLCPGSENTATAQAFFENPTVCAERIRTFGAAQFDDLVASIRAGRVRLDGAAARQCLDRLAASCSVDDLDTAQLCPSALTGTIAAGGGCWRNIECAAGTFCDHSGGADPLTCPGTCRAQLAPGATCTSARQCLVPANHVAVCDATCRDGTVGATAVEGAQCGSVPNGTNAVTLIACGAGLYCANVTNNVGTCRRNLTAGAPCTRADACPSGLACVASAGTTTTTCRRVTVVDTVGGACDMRGQTGYCNPLLGLRCNATMTCERVGDGTANAPCQGGDFFQSCQPGLYCNSTTMTCQAKLAAGAACTGDSACLSGECSGGAQGRCLERICD